MSVAYGTLPLTADAHEDRTSQRRRAFLGAGLTASLVVVLVVAITPGHNHHDARHVHLASRLVGSSRLIALDTDAEAALLAAGAPANEATCLDSFSSPFRAACQLQFLPSKQVELEAAYRSCAWRRLPWPRGAYAGHSDAGYKTDEKPFPMGAGVGLEKCTFGSFDRRTYAGDASAEGAWELHRIGPFNTTGGKDWTSVQIGPIHRPDGWNDSVAIAQGHVELELAPEGSESLHVGRDWSWPPGPHVLAIRQYFLGAVDLHGHLVGYPPIHQHHFHVEEANTTSLWGAMISHGDEQCVAPAGGVNCQIKKVIPGYAIKMELPLMVTNDMNDVRAKGSRLWTWYQLIAIKGMPDDGTFRSFTQVKIILHPLSFMAGYFGTYQVPADSISAFWREGTFLVSSPLLWSYFHTHPANAEEMLIYVGRNSTQIGLDSLTNIDQTFSSTLTRADMHITRRSFMSRAEAAGAQLKCHYQRNDALLETVENTSEVGNHFYRASASCIPFEIRKGLPFVALVINSPCSEAAAEVRCDKGGVGLGHQEPGPTCGNQHSFIRFFVDSDEYTGATCPDKRASNPDGACYELHNAEAIAAAVKAGAQPVKSGYSSGRLSAGV